MTPRQRPIRVLYVVYWGAMEPLGRSLVVPAVLRLAEIGVEITLITFEKSDDVENHCALESMQTIFKQAGVEWHPLRYHKTPKWPATAFDAGTAVLKAFVLSLRDRFDLVHARTFVAGPIGFVIAKLLRARFVYHNEGFYPDEQVDGGVWRNNSFVHRLAKRVEDFLYRKADGLVVLSERAREILIAQYGSVAKPAIVVPSAVDLEAFRPGASGSRKQPLSLVYLGSVGLRYRLDDAGRFVKAVRAISPDTRLTVVSRADRRLVEEMLGAAELPREAWTLKELPHSDVPAELRLHDAGLFFLTEGLSEHGCSPTKIGEYWASGLPVVTTPNVSDTDAVVKQMGVGVVIAAKGNLRAAAQQLLDLFDDEGLSIRCRAAAQTIYSLTAACDRQRALYERLNSR